MGVRVSFVTIGAFQENSYLLVDEATNDAVLIDPGADDPRLMKLIEASGARPSAIWLTHGHLDHIGGIAMVKRKFDVPVYLHPADQPVYAAQSMFAEAYQIPFEEPAPADREFADGDVVNVGATAFTVMHTPGHAPGHVIFVGDELVMAGDLLFAGSVGRTDLPLASPAAMDVSLKKIGALASHLSVYPGHGPATTIGAELRSNPFLNGSVYVKGYSA